MYDVLAAQTIILTQSEYLCVYYNKYYIYSKNKCNVITNGVLGHDSAL